MYKAFVFFNHVLLPYEITLFSNLSSLLRDRDGVLLPYEITLFSNLVMTDEELFKFYYLMKLHYSQTRYSKRKQARAFYYLMKLHYSQTRLSSSSTFDVFYYLMKLHYSQTQGLGTV